MPNKPMLYDTPRMPPKYIDRVSNPQNYPVLNNPNGSVSTHEMAAEIDEDTGRWMTFPMIQQMPDGSLKRFEDTREAMSNAKKQGNALQWQDSHAAIEYAKGGYKKGTPLAEPMQGILKQYGGKK